MLIPFDWLVNFLAVRSRRNHALTWEGWGVGKSSGHMHHKVEDKVSGDVQCGKPVVEVQSEGKVAHVDHWKSWWADVEMKRW